MKAIIPVAGVGTRMRPHTHTYPKALLFVGGKPILGHILNEVKKLDIKEVILILGYMGNKIKAYVEEDYPDMNFVYAEQKKRLGLGHAIYQAEPFVKDDDSVLIIYGDTIFVGDISKGKESDRDAMIGVKIVDDPRRFGVVEKKQDKVVNLVEKPDYVKPMPAIVGVNFINNSKLMFECLKELMEKNIKTKQEYQLTDAFQLMLEKGADFSTFELDGWYDCGKPETMLKTNKYLLDKKTKVIKTKNSVIIDPVYIEDSAEIENSVIGPYVSVAKDTVIKSSIIKNSILNKGCMVLNAQLTDSLIGENAVVDDIVEKLNVGDNSKIRYSGK
ncbi:NTP transferase domain-containing protein [Candidatus Woesearchaeota archaeon]|nr:NTP transferase domain-containing protein [Candidatus Woesearchaeota archaeon]